MSESAGSAWSASAYFASSLVACTLQEAWELMLNYETWNPGFARAEVVRVQGQPRAEGELVLIRAKDHSGAWLPEIYAETVRVIPQRRITWFVSPKDGNAFRNFLDFALSETPGGVRFEISWYALDQMTGEPLLKQRRETEEGARSLAMSFKNHCETVTSKSSIG